MSGPPPPPWAGELGLPSQKGELLAMGRKSRSKVTTKTKGVVLAWGSIYNPPLKKKKKNSLKQKPSFTL